MLKELHQAASKGELSCRIGAYRVLEDGKEITDDEISSFAQKHNLDKKFVDKPAVGRWYCLSYDKKKDN